MERQLIERVFEEENVEVSKHKDVLNLVQSCSRETLNITFQDSSILTIQEKYVAYEEKMRAGHLGKTATFWFRVIDHTRLLLMLQKPVA